MLPSTPLKFLIEQAAEEQENACPNSQQPLRSAIHARLQHLELHHVGPMPPTAHEAFAESVAVLMSGSDLPSSGWQSWPVASEAYSGLVYLPCEGRWGYFSGVEADDDCVVHFGAPLAGRAHIYPRAALLLPPFNDRHTAVRQTAVPALVPCGQPKAPSKEPNAPLTPTTDRVAKTASRISQLRL